MVSTCCLAYASWFKVDGVRVWTIRNRRFRGWGESRNSTVHGQRICLFVNPVWGYSTLTRTGICILLNEGKWSLNLFDKLYNRYGAIENAAFLQRNFYLLVAMDPDNCALNTDSSPKMQKRLNRITLTQPNKILPPIGISASKHKAPIFQFGNQLGPEHFSATKWMWEEAAFTKVNDCERTHGSKRKGSTTMMAQLKV